MDHIKIALNNTKIPLQNGKKIQKCPNIFPPKKTKNAPKKSKIPQRFFALKNTKSPHRNQNVFFRGMFVFFGVICFLWGKK